MKKKIVVSLSTLIILAIIFQGCKPKQTVYTILINGKIVTVDPKFTITEALAIEKDRIIAAGSNKEIKKLAGSQARIIDLKGKTAIPGLIDAHLHPETASLSELDEKIPDVHTIPELLDWIKGQASVKPKGEWIIHPKLFFTRLKELRQPTLTELDNAAPYHPVFLNGSYGGMINSAAIKVSGISKDTNNPGIIKDKKTGKPTGLLRAAAFKLLKIPPKKELSEPEKQDALVNMLRRYNECGFTSVCAAQGNSETYKMYCELKNQNRLTVRIFQNIELGLTTGITAQAVRDRLNALPFVTGDGDEWVRIGALKILLDGGILTGTAYMREPWGNKAGEIFGITDTTYRGIVNYSREDLLTIVTAANEKNWKFTAHSTGGGGVDLLLDVYDEVNKIKPIRDRRFSIIHGNFFTGEAIKKMQELGVYADAQPAWFYKDADAMLSILGEKRMLTFHPYKTLVDAGIIINGGSDHMVKWDANTSVNPYNPFLGMWTMITHTTERGTVLLPQETISREQALKIYTINNALASFEERIKGSLEPGKLADLVVLSDDILTCPVDQIKYIKPELTMVGGNIVYSSGKVE